MDRNSGVITVIIPTFNRKDMLKNALDSVLSETRIPIKAHVFDNASTDGTQQYLQERAKQDPRLIITRNETNIGALGNYKKALSSVETDFYVPLGDDDWLLPDFLYRAHLLLREEPNAYAAIFFAESRNKNGKLDCTYPENLVDFPSGVLSPEEHMKAFFSRGHYLWSAIVWRKETLDHVGHPFLHTGLTSDVDFQIQVFSEFPVVVCPQMGAVYNLHAGSHASGNFSILEIPSWGEVALHMDQFTSRLYSASEYENLKKKFRDRYGPTWRKRPVGTVEQNKLNELAVIALEQLGDVELATSLFQGVLPKTRRTPWEKLVRSFSKRMQQLKKHHQSRS
ncbi:MAG: glycosyltransferase family A protein [Pseudomonadota bacterium]